MSSGASLGTGDWFGQRVEVGHANGGDEERNPDHGVPVLDGVRGRLCPMPPRLISCCSEAAKVGTSRRLKTSVDMMPSTRVTPTDRMGVTATMAAPSGPRSR